MTGLPDDIDRTIEWWGQDLTIEVSSPELLRFTHDPTASDAVVPVIHIQGLEGDLWWQPPAGTSCTIGLQDGAVVIPGAPSAGAEWDGTSSIRIPLDVDFAISAAELSVHHPDHPELNNVIGVPKASCPHGLRPAKRCPYWPTYEGCYEGG